MEKEEATKILIDRIKDHEALLNLIWKTLSSRGSNCLHPILIKFDKKNKNVHCMFCGKIIKKDNTNEVWKRLENRNKVNIAMRILKNKSKNIYVAK